MAERRWKTQAAQEIGIKKFSFEPVPCIKGP